MAKAICTVCDHPHLRAIDRALVMGKSVRDVATEYQLSRSAVGRHRKDHLAKKLQRAEQNSLAEANRLVSMTWGVAARLRGLLDKAEGGGDLRTAVAAARELLHALENVGKLTGAVENNTTVNVLAVGGEAMQVLQMKILEALQPYPEARFAVAKMLAPGEVTSNQPVDAEFVEVVDEHN